MLSCLYLFGGGLLKKRLRPLICGICNHFGFEKHQQFSLPAPVWRSETSKCRERLAPYCLGYGVDLGFGGDPITAHAIRVDQPSPYTNVGIESVQLGGDARNLLWFKDEVLDFVYSSHLLEDYEDTENVLREWLRVIKPGGRLILYCPDEQVFRKHCAHTGQSLNPYHIHAEFSFNFVKTILEKIGCVEFVHERRLIDTYSWELVCEKKLSGGKDVGIIGFRLNKLVEWTDLVQLRGQWKVLGKTVVWTNGCFDLLHIGHVRSLQAARAAGHILVVGVNSDTSVRVLKGEARPIVPLADRMQMLAALECVDYVVSFDELTPERCLRELQPDIHCKGADYAPPGGKPIPEASLVYSYGGKIIYIPIESGISTTAIIKSIGSR